MRQILEASMTFDTYENSAACGLRGRTVPAHRRLRSKRAAPGPGRGGLLALPQSLGRTARGLEPTVLAERDLVTVLVEVADRDRYWVEIGGLFSIGEPSAHARNLANGCYEALRLVGERAGPGERVAAAADALDEVAARRELAPQLGLGHGIGIDHDLPLLTSASDAVFDTGQVISVHPSLSDAENGIGAMVADAFHVTPAGAEGLGNLPPELTVLG